MSLLLPSYANCLLYDLENILCHIRYRNGVFHFTVKLPSEYNSLGVSPQVTFNPPVFNPLVNPTTGSMQLTLSDTLLDVWIPEKHFLATVVTAIKKMFYMKSYETFPSGCLADESARALFESNKPVFLEKVEDCVRRSLQEAEGMVGMDARAIKPANVGSIQFSCEQPAHAILRQAILGELTAARAAELQERRSKAADAEGLPVAATINQSPLPYHFHANNGADNESMAVDAALNIDAEARLLAEEVMNALDIFKVPLDSSHPAWDIPQGTLSSNELGKGEAVGLSSAGMAAFYDLSNEVEDECDANTISVVNMK